MTDIDITTMPLTDVETTRFIELEQDVERGIGLAGRALDEINSGRLYRQTHSSFEAYVRDRFQWSRAHAYRQIEHAKVVEILSPIGDIPNEAQARELGGLEPALVREVWSAANEATDGRPTAQSVTQARERIVPKPVQTSMPTARPKPAPTYGPRRKHREKLGAVAIGLSGYQIVLSEITELDNTVTAAAAERIGTGLDQAVTEIKRIMCLLVERSLSSTMLADVIITTNHNSAFVQSTDEVRGALQQLGIRDQAVPGAKGRRTFPVGKANALVDALQNRGIDARVVNETAGQ